MSKYVLIEANTSIFTKQFDSFDDARNEMLNKLEADLSMCGLMDEVEDILEDDWDYDEHDEPDGTYWEEVKGFSSYSIREDESWGFTFGMNWANFCFKYDDVTMWKIIEVQ